MIINFKKKLTASDIYNLVSQEQLISYYLGETIKPDKLFHCCFHKDKTASLGFYKTQYGNIRYKCFGCNAEGGAIEFIMKKENLNYPQALDRISKDFNLNKGLYDQIVKVTNQSSEFKESASERLRIIPIQRPFELYDKEIWEQYGLDLIDLYNGKVYACQQVDYINREGHYKTFCYNFKTNPIYCIELAKGVYKIYRPLNPEKRGKWFANAGSEDLQGLPLLEDYRLLLIITSSMKDALVLKKLGYQAVAPSGEGVRIPDNVWNYLEATSQKIIFFNDSDRAGYEYTFKLAKERNKDYIFIPTYYLVKDISDFVKEYGIEEARKLMNRLLKRKI